jgi:hypothetical protein
MALVEIMEHKKLQIGSSSNVHVTFLPQPPTKNAGQLESLKLWATHYQHIILEIRCGIFLGVPTSNNTLYSPPKKIEK